MSGARNVIVNGGFRPQRVTGQQRYATEIADRLLSRNDFTELLPPHADENPSSVKVWAWVLATVSRKAGAAVLLSLTARAPVRRRPHVVVVHDLFVLTHPEWYSRRYVLSHAPLLRSHLRDATAIVAVSEPVADEVRELFAGEIVVATNAPSTVFSVVDANGDRAVLAARGLDHGAYLLTVGSMDPRKNLATLAEAYGRLPRETRRVLPLVIAGGSAAVYRDEQISWPEGTVHTGYLTDSELRALYGGARAVVFPSKAEGFGLPLVEAFAAGAGGFVASDIPVFRWICGEAAIYVDPASVDSLAAGLQHAADGDVPAPSIEQGRFDWGASADVVAELCTRLAGTTS